MFCRVAIESVQINCLNVLLGPEVCFFASPSPLPKQCIHDTLPLLTAAFIRATSRGLIAEARTAPSTTRWCRVVTTSCSSLTPTATSDRTGRIAWPRAPPSVKRLCPQKVTRTANTQPSHFQKQNDRNRVSYVSKIHTSHTKHIVHDLLNVNGNHAPVNYSGKLYAIMFLEYLLPWNRVKVMKIDINC